MKMKYYILFRINHDFDNNNNDKMMILETLTMT